MSTDKFEDIEVLLNQAVENNGLRILFVDNKAAIRWRMRAYTFRREMQKINKEIYSKSDNIETRVKAGSTPWDKFIITIEDNVVTIKSIYSLPPIVVQTLDGEPLNKDLDNHD